MEIEYPVMKELHEQFNEQIECLKNSIFKELSISELPYRKHIERDRVIQFNNEANILVKEFIKRYSLIRETPYIKLDDNEVIDNYAKMTYVNNS